MKVKISYLLSGLKDREKDIICSLFGIGCAECSEYTLSLRYNMTEERIRQIKLEVFKKMKDLA
jgi:DNA-directed RNA polymerase sigma subunit (sigma70/sigma32)